MGYSTALVAGRTARSCRRRCARPSRARSRGPPSVSPRPGAVGHPRQAPRSCARGQYGFVLLIHTRNALVEDAPTLHPLAPPLVPALVERLQLVGGQRFRARPERRQRLQQRHLARGGRREEIAELSVRGRRPRARELCRTSESARARGDHGRVQERGRCMRARTGLRSLELRGERLVRVLEVRALLLRRSERVRRGRGRLVLVRREERRLA
jgi:hypothetical protein